MIQEVASVNWLLKKDSNFINTFEVFYYLNLF